MINILVTDFADTGENVCILNANNITCEDVEKALRNRTQYFTEVHEVPDDQLQYYLYDPLWSNEIFENQVLKHSKSK